LGKQEKISYHPKVIVSGAFVAIQSYELACSTHMHINDCDIVAIFPIARDPGGSLGTYPAKPQEPKTKGEVIGWWLFVFDRGEHFRKVKTPLVREAIKEPERVPPIEVIRRWTIASVQEVDTVAG
jgi:hypothetical protein